MDAADVLTVAQIYDRYPEEWMLVGDPTTTEMHDVLSGTILWHSKSRDEVYKKAIELRPKTVAYLYTGEAPPDAVLVLCNQSHDEDSEFARDPTASVPPWVALSLGCGRRPRSKGP